MFHVVHNSNFFCLQALKAIQEERARAAELKAEEERQAAAANAAEAERRRKVEEERSAAAAKVGDVWFADDDRSTVLI